MNPPYRHVDIDHKSDQNHSCAVCKGCQWRAEHGQGSAADAARAHCKETGHHVIVERSVIYILRPKHPIHGNN